MDLKYINPYKNKKVRTIGIYDEFKMPVFDRSQSDIDYLKELLEKGFDNFTDEEKEMWLNNDLKGALNASDLNRIEGNIKILSNVFEINLNCKTNWLSYDIPDGEKDFKRIYNNLKTLLEYAVIYEETPSLPEYNESSDCPFNDYEKLNIIENIIFDIYDVLMSHFDNYCLEEGQYCGEIWC